MRTAVLAILLGIGCLSGGAVVVVSSLGRPHTLRYCLERDFAAKGIKSDFMADSGEFFGRAPRGRYEGTFNGGRVRVVYRQVDEENWELVSLEHDQ